MKVLLVEDHPLNLELATVVLEAAGHDVEAACDGAQVRRWLAAGGEPPAIVLMDILLPDADGVTLLGELRRDPRLDLVPVVALTAQAIGRETERLHLAGFDAVLVKPIDTRGFATAVEALARIRRR